MTDNTYQKKLEKLQLNYLKWMLKNISAIKEKYIIPGETSKEAIMFLPAEAIFARNKCLS